MNKYSVSQQLLHHLALSSNFLKELYFDLEKNLYLNKANEINDNHVFIAGMARSGTTIILNAIYESNEFASFTYEEMPFILAPNLWSNINQDGIAIEKKERAHGDGISINTNSPEAFEEVFWKTFDSNDSDSYNDFNNLLKLLCMKYDKTRYLSKNNQNINRIDKILEHQPHSKIIIPFRDPIQQSFSLLNQHKRFSLLQKEDAFIRRYMSWIGHSEFGKDYQPIFEDGTAYDNHDSLDHWLEQWLLAYRSLEIYQEILSVRFVCYERLCHGPKEWESLLKFIGLKTLYGFDFNESKKKISDSYDGELHNKCKKLYEKLLEK